MQVERFPSYISKEASPENTTNILVLTQAESELITNEKIRAEFLKSGNSTHHLQTHTHHYLTPKKALTYKITENSFINFSKATQQLHNYYGVATQLLTSAYKFSRKQKVTDPHTIYISNGTKDLDHIIRSAKSKNQAKEWANGRGDVEGIPQYFLNQAQNIAKQFPDVKLVSFKGAQLLQKGFRLMHAVGRASVNKPIFINLTYNGNPDSEEYVAYVGKGVCFDTGGLDIKTAAGMKDMFLDKHGAVSVLSAFRSVVQEKIKINLTVSMGFVQNSINENAYRPSDIIQSRKGLCVEIGNTDAEGRLVLADCMNWTQQTYKTAVMIELSTLTGAIIIALGSRYAGMFGNDKDLKKQLTQAGQQVNQQVWQMPIDDYHRDLVRPKYADLTCSSGNTDASSSQAAAFLNHFVQKGVKWIHLDVAGVCIVNKQGSGYGARLLVQYARNYAKL